MKSGSCPCCSGKSYNQCCRKYHEGTLPENALVLMRSRYSAYALDIAPYIIQSTHPKSPHLVKDKKQWIRELHLFSTQVIFEKLEIREWQFGDDESYVTFTAYLSKDGKDLTFTEKSRFLKEGNQWLYVDGVISRGASWRATFS